MKTSDTMSEMETDDDESFVQNLFSYNSGNWHSACRNIRNTVIGSRKQKSYFINVGILPRLLQLMSDDDVDLVTRQEAAVVLGSLARGSLDNVHALLEAGCLSVLFKGVTQPCLKYVEACLRCLRTIFTAKSQQIDIMCEDASVIPQLISLLNRSVCTQECITKIIAHCCLSLEQQLTLCDLGLIDALAPLLTCDIARVQMPAICCLTSLCYQNTEVSVIISTACYNGECMPDLLVKLLARDKPVEMQVAAAKCLTYLCRAGAVDPTDPIISLKTLSTLVRMCKKDRPIANRVEGAELLAYLTEGDLQLQDIASYSDHLITMLADYFKMEEQRTDMHQAALVAFASLSANDEDIRKKVIEIENLMEHIISGLSSPLPKVQLASVRCMHSLSRSVQQLRTSFQDHAVWKPLMKILHSASEDVLTVASSTLCNLLLEFSPSKEPILELGGIDLLVDLTKRENSALRLNGIWALMNMAFQADQKVKGQILSSLGTDQLFRLLTDPNVEVLMKTLGLLRNLLSNKHHIDHMMHVHGKQIIQAVILILEGDHPVQVKEQAICIVANIADGDSAKDFIMDNDDVLKKLLDYMAHSSVQLQIAATYCVGNLTTTEEDGALDRQARLREMGFQRRLQQLLNTNDSTLFDKVNTVLQQFS